MTTTNNPILTTAVSPANRKRAVLVGVVLGIGAATLAASVVQGEPAPSHKVDPATVYSELAPVTAWARSQGLSGLSPASLRRGAD